MRKLVVAFRNFPNAPNKALFISHKLALYHYMFISILRACTQLHLFLCFGEELNGMTDSKDRTYFQLNEVSKGRTDRETDRLALNYNYIETACPLRDMQSVQERATDLRNRHTTVAGLQLILSGA
jgi:hypothetical protein